MKEPKFLPKFYVDPKDVDGTFTYQPYLHHPSLLDWIRQFLSKNSGPHIWRPFLLCSPGTHIKIDFFNKIDTQGGIRSFLNPSMLFTKMKDLIFHK